MQWTGAVEQSKAAADSAGMFCGYYGPKSSMGRTVREMIEGLGVTVVP